MSDDPGLSLMSRIACYTSAACLSGTPGKKIMRVNPGCKIARTHPRVPSIGLYAQAGLSFVLVYAGIHPHTPRTVTDDYDLCSKSSPRGK